MKKILFAIALLGMAVSCTVNESEFSKFGKNVIKATTDAETRMAIKPVGDGTFSHLWEEGDAVAVYDGYHSTKYELSEGAGTTKGDFTGDELTTGQLLYPVFYPYSDDLDIYTIDGKNLFGYTFPSVVEKSVENYEQNVMIGMLDNGTVQMKNCAAYIKLAYATEVLSSVESIKIEAIGGEDICGKFLFGYDGATGLPFAVPDGSSIGGNTVTLNFPGGEMLTANTRSFYVALPPVGQLSKGLRITFYGDFNGETELEYTSSDINLERNVVIDFESIYARYDIPVAEVAGEQFKELVKAFEAATAIDGDATVKMIESAKSIETLNVNKANGKIILDLNGKKVGANVKCYTDFELTDGVGGGVLSAAKNVVTVGMEGDPSDATFVMDGGTIKATDGNYAIHTEGTSSVVPTVIVKKGKLIAENGYLMRVKYANATFGDGTEGEISCDSKSGFWTSTNSNVVINKGTFHGVNRFYYFGSGTLNLTINDGTFVSDGPIFTYYTETTNPTVAIKGGMYTWAASDEFVQAANTKTQISGGYFSGKIKNVNIANGYAREESDEIAGFPYKVIVNNDNSVMKVGKVKYENVADAVAAINAATSDVTVEFLANLELTDEIAINNPNAKITLDLAGRVVRAKKESGYSAVVVDGANTVVDFIDSEGGGIFDHAYANTAYTLTVKAGTANLISANISNMTSSGYGRVAVRVIATTAPAHFNMTGGVVRGGRAIRVSGASETARAYVTVSGGLVEGRNTDDANYYTAISTETGYSNVLINGGTIIGNGAKSIIYCNKDNAGTSTIVITKNEVTGTIPFLYSNGCKYAVAAGGSADYGKLVYTGPSWNYYTNNSSNSWVGTTLTKEALSPTVTDEYGNEYTHRIYK